MLLRLLLLVELLLLLLLVRELVRQGAGAPAHGDDRCAVGADDAAAGAKRSEGVSGSRGAADKGARRRAACAAQGGCTGGNRSRRTVSGSRSSTSSCSGGGSGGGGSGSQGRPDDADAEAERREPSGPTDDDLRSVFRRGGQRRSSAPRGGCGCGGVNERGLRAGRKLRLPRELPGLKRERTSSAAAVKAAAASTSASAPHLLLLLLPLLLRHPRLPLLLLGLPLHLRRHGPSSHLRPPPSPSRNPNATPTSTSNSSTSDSAAAPLPPQLPLPQLLLPLLLLRLDLYLRRLHALPLPGLEVCARRAVGGSVPQSSHDGVGVGVGRGPEHRRKPLAAPVDRDEIRSKLAHHARRLFFGKRRVVVPRRRALQAQVQRRGKLQRDRADPGSVGQRRPG